MMIINAAIIDDEKLARLRLRRLLGSIGVKVLAEGKNGVDAVELAHNSDIDLLFLDINMPVLDGLTAAKQIGEMGDAAPAMIFCTAYTEHAIEAFETKASAYLLKPFTEEALAAAIEKASQVSRFQLSQLPDNDNLIISAGGANERHAVPWKQVLYFYSEEKFVFASLVDGRSVLIDKTLKQLEDELEGLVVRVHRATLVSRSKMHRLFKGSAGIIKLELCDHDSEQKDGLHIASVPVSRRHSAKVKKCFS